MAQKKQASQNADETNEGWAERIRQAIDDSGLTDSEIAVKISKERPLSPRTIYNWKSTGQISQPYIDVFCRVVDCDVAWLVQGSSKQQTEISRTVGTDVGFTIKRVPMREPEQLLDQVHSMDAAQPMAHIDVDELTKDWLLDNRASTDVAFTWLDGSDVPGYPSFAIQITAQDHEPDIATGAICGVAQDIYPGRGDYAFFLKRKRFGKDYSPWTFNAGFFYTDARSVPTNDQLWWEQHAENAYDESFWLTMKLNETSRDDVEINFSDHQFVYVGTAVAILRWTSPLLSDERTQLPKRKATRMRRRTHNRE